MLIKIGYDVALRFPISTPVIYCFESIRRVGQIWRLLSLRPAQPMCTRLVRRRWIFLIFLLLRWSFYYRADIARLTVSLWISLGGPFSRQDSDGNGSKRFCDFVHGHLQFDYQQHVSRPTGAFSLPLWGRQPSPGVTDSEGSTWQQPR